jgi:1,2-phenylacetyl-CoA epoxidase PaaB subunit
MALRSFRRSLQSFPAIVGVATLLLMGKAVVAVWSVRHLEAVAAPTTANPAELEAKLNDYLLKETYRMLVTLSGSVDDVVSAQYRPDLIELEAVQLAKKNVTSYSKAFTDYQRELQKFVDRHPDIVSAQPAETQQKIQQYLNLKIEDYIQRTTQASHEKWQEMIAGKNSIPLSNLVEQGLGN